MKLDKEFKNEVDQEVKQGTYIFGKVFVRIMAVVIILSVLGSGGNYVYKKWITERNNEVFKESTTYKEAAATFLADAFQDYNDAESDTQKDAVMEYVIMRYPNLDDDAIDNDTLRQFYNKCLNN